MNRLDHVLTNNLKNNKDQINEAINSELTFDSSNYNLSSGTINPLPVVTVSLRGGKKQIETTVSSLTFLWGVRATNSMINRRDMNHYDRNILFNKLD